MVSPSLTLHIFLFLAPPSFTPLCGAGTGGDEDRHGRLAPTNCKHIDDIGCVIVVNMGVRKVPGCGKQGAHHPDVVG